VAALGLKMTDLFPPREDAGPAPEMRGKPLAVYDYHDAEGALLFQVLRWPPKEGKKQFSQRRPTPNGWIPNLAGVPKVLYHLPEVLAAIGDGKRIWIPEGEKDADRLRAVGLVGTCNSGGASKWLPEHAEPLRGAAVCILPDNDKPGRTHALVVARSLAGVAASIKIVELPELPPKGDVSDWLDADGTREGLVELTEAAPEWAAPEAGMDAGANGTRNFDIAGIEKVCTQPPVYYVDVLGGRVKMGVDELMIWPRFQSAVMQALNRVPDLRNAQMNWHPYLDSCLQARLKVTPAPEEASPEAMLWGHVQSYLARQSTPDESALAEHRGVYSNERFLYFNGPTLHRKLSARGVSAKPSELWDVLRKHGAQAGLKKVRNSAGRRCTVAAWLIEKTEIEDQTEQSEGGE
jgi:hypothetical protein